MSKPKAPTELRGNLGEIKQAIRDGVAQIVEAKKDRTSANADISAIVERLEAKGIPRRALKMAMQYSEWDADARSGFDMAYAIVREAIGCPFDGQLFDGEGKPASEAKGKKTTPEQAALN